MQFSELNLITPIRNALEAEGYVVPTEIQEQAIPSLLEGRDLIGCAQTGTGKTCAFAVPILQKLAQEISSESRSLKSSEFKSAKPKRTIRALIVTPTRELAIQIGESFAVYGRYLNLRGTVVFGGVSQRPQTDALTRGVDILVATPGRLLDLMNQRYIDLSNVKCFVLDEADRMFDMGFVIDVRKIVAHLPNVRQTMLFSATMPQEIVRLAESILNNPVRISVTPESPTVDTIEQAVYYVSRGDKRMLLTHLLKHGSVSSALVFSRTKHGADKIIKDLSRSGIRAQAIHGNKSQSARQLALSDFKARKTSVLVATDIAARGIDIDRLSHVINYDLPNIPETYIHRIGRTGRAGYEGVALSFCDAEERPYLKDIEKLIRRPIPVVADHPYPLTLIALADNKVAHMKSLHKPGGRNPFNSRRRRSNSPQRVSGSMV